MQNPRTKEQGKGPRAGISKTSKATTRKGRSQQILEGAPPHTHTHNRALAAPTPESTGFISTCSLTGGWHLKEAEGGHPLSFASGLLTCQHVLPLPGIGVRKQAQEKAGGIAHPPPIFAFREGNLPFPTHKAPEMGTWLPKAGAEPEENLPSAPPQPPPQGS